MVRGYWNGQDRRGNDQGGTEIPIADENSARRKIWAAYSASAARIA
jgi:hypothetical protein